MDDRLWFDVQEGRAPLAPNSKEPDPEEAIKQPELRARMAALINGQLLAKGEVLQSQFLTEFEGGSERRDEGKKGTDHRTDCSGS